MLLEETLLWLAPERGGLFVDCTLGLGGHAHALLARFPAARLLGIDRDPRALALARERLAGFGDRARCIEGNFRDLESLWGEHAAGEAPPAGIYADLGMSSLQLDDAGRAFLQQQLTAFDAARETAVAAGARNGALQNRVEAMLSAQQARQTHLTELIGNRTDDITRFYAMIAPNCNAEAFHFNGVFIAAKR